MGLDGSGNEFTQLKFQNTSDNIVGNLTLADEPLSQARITFNGEDRLSGGNRNALYFNKVQPFYHHTVHT